MSQKQNNGTSVTKINSSDVRVFYDQTEALHGVNLEIYENSVTALIGPSGCGKSTFLRCINRMNDVIEGCRTTGKITLDNEDIYDKGLDVVQLREKVGMVFQKPNPFPKSIYDNIAYGPQIHGLAQNRQEMDEIVENSLKKSRTLRGSQRSFKLTWNRTLRWTTTATVYCQGDCSKPRSHFNG